ncbi:MAG: 3-hydroxyacyl-CoA dehydrogenase [Acidobacteria bacterium]|nr:3-hydroxyacyl-CoA dehydrogenase [Acidobacteriota bacterium]
MRTITVAGAGAKGREVAAATARAGYRTILEDISGQVIDLALDEIRRLAGEEALARIEPERALDRAAAEADLVIETVPDDMETKIEVYTLLDRAAGPHCIFASVTSCLSITEIASLTYRPSLVLGMHFSSNAKLLELVRGLETSLDTLAAAEQVGLRLGREVVRVKESPGLIAGRLSALLGNEAFQMLEQGVASAADIDRAAKLGLGHSVGPLEWADQTGLDTCLDLLERLHRSLGEKYRPALLLAQYVKAGRLGRKTGRGVYDYGTAKRQAGKS